MIAQKFFNILTNGKEDIVQILLNLLKESDSAYCLIGGLAVNAYAEPVVSLDLDLVVVSDKIKTICDLAQSRRFDIRNFKNSIYLYIEESDLRIQLQTDPRYQDFLSRARLCNVLGYEMYVASLEDVLKGKIWAWSDEERRKSKRQKDLSDIMRLVEAHPELKDQLPHAIRTLVES